MIFTNSKHPSETQLEQYVQFQEELPDEVVSAITSHLAACSVCRNIVEWFRDFYADLWVEQDREVSQADVIQLQPYKVQRKDNIKGPIVLAAMGQEVQHRFVRVATLSSEEDGIIVRLLSDEKKGVFELYLHTREPLSAPAIVEFPLLGFEVITSEDGKAIFTPSPDIDRSTWSDTKAVVHLPFGTTHLESADLKEGSKSVKKVSWGTEELSIEFRIRSDQLMIHCHGEANQENSVSYLLISRKDFSPSLLALDQGVGFTSIMEWPDGDSDIMLYH